MDLFLIGLYDHVVHAYLKCLAYLLLKDLVHHPLICCIHILQSERHDIVLVIIFFSHEGHILLVGYEHRYLVVPEVSIHE